MRLRLSTYLSFITSANVVMHRCSAYL